MENSCRICGSSSGNVLETKQVANFISNWAFCEGCGSAHIDPYPTEDQLVEYYNSNYLNMDLVDGGDSGVSHKVRFSEEYKETVFIEYRYSCADVKLSIGNLIEQNHTVLDYGCANGVFLDWLARNGCKKDNLHGYDIGVSMVNEAISNGFNCTSDIERLEGHSFNLITLWDVIEHVPYPRSIVKKVKSLLKGGGEVLVQTPNFGELAIYMGDAYAHYLVVEHLHLFSRRALINLFEDEGFLCLAQASFGANAFIKHVGEPYKTAYDKLAKRFDFGATQVLLFGLES